MIIIMMILGNENCALFHRRLLSPGHCPDWAQYKLQVANGDDDDDDDDKSDNDDVDNDNDIHLNLNT